jgi:glycosyltransferase involved in cell wall biosynthesis
MKLSLIIPAYNEEDNVVPLFREIKRVLDDMPLFFKKLNVSKLSKKYTDYEIIIIDDGSTDNTFKNLSSIKDKHLRIIKFRKNFGQSAAWLAGIDNSKGDIIITMDADMQNDPRDIPRLLARLDQGYDCVSGWRYKRKDTFMKHIFSRISNFLRHIMISDNINDSGCSLKVYKKECLEGIELYGEMHRYIVSLIKLRGFKISELKVRHRKRIMGKTKYNLYRVLKGFLDLWNVWFWQKFSDRPLHLFGSTGVVSIFFGTLLGIYTVYLKLIKRVSLSDTFLPVVAVFLIIIGVHFFISGILSDILIKTYKKTGNIKTYEIEKIF